MAFLSANSYLGLAPETTRGTAATTGAIYIPVTTPQTTPMQTFLRDEAFRGSPTTVYDHVQGIRHDEYDAKVYLYADTFGNLVKSVLGGVDTVQTSVPNAGLYTHTIKLLNSASIGSQPQSYSILDFDGANYFLMTGAQADSLNITFGAEAAADATVKFMANPYTSSTSAPAGTAFSTFTWPANGDHMIPAWNTVVQYGPIGGSLTTYNWIQTGELSIARKTTPIHTMGQQSPYALFAGPIEVTGKFTAVVDNNADSWSTASTYTPVTTTTGTLSATADALSRDPQKMIITMTDPNDNVSTGSQSIGFTLNNVQMHDVKRTRGKEYTEVEVSFTANANTTDATTGFSPIQATIVNAVTNAY